MSTYDRSEVEAAFRHYFLTGPVHEDWVAWSNLFTEDVTYTDHFYGVFQGRDEVKKFLESTMSFAPHVYSALVWYNIDGNQIVYKLMNRADNPEPGGSPIEFPSLQVIEYAGNGQFSSEEDWWIKSEMKKFNELYTAQAQAHDPDHKYKKTRNDWGPWVDWARPSADHVAKPSWEGRDDVPKVANIRDMDFGKRL
jgi:SnoaL-like domain